MILVIERLLGKSSLYKGALTLSGNFYSISVVLIVLYWLFSFVQIVLSVTETKNVLARSSYSNNLHNCFYHSWLLSSILVVVSFDL